MKSDHLAAETEVGHHLGGNLADGAEFATFGRMCWVLHQDTSSHRQTRRLPKCHGAMMGEGLELHRNIVFNIIV